MAAIEIRTSEAGTTAERIVENWNSDDNVINVKRYVDGSIRVSVRDDDHDYVISQAWLSGPGAPKAVLLRPMKKI